MTNRTRRIAAALTAVALACAPTPSNDSARTGAGAPRMIIDGVFDDWRGVPVSAAAVGHATTPTFHSASMTADGEALFLRFRTSSPLVLQAHDAATRIVIDVDGAPATGGEVDGLEGADLVLEFSPESAGGGARGGFVARAANGAMGTAHDVGYTGLPTHQSNEFEARIERSTLEEFAGVPLGGAPRARIVSDVAGAESVASAVFTWSPPPPAQVATPAEADALAPADGTAVRIVAWNVADRSFRAQADAFVRVLRALAPDVLLLDELPATTTHEELAAFLARLGDGWTFVLGSGGGRQRATVASRLPLAAAKAFERVPYPDSIRDLLPLATFPQTRRDLTTALEDGVSTAGGFVTVGDRRVLIVAVDLACCGGAESVEDRFRRIQAHAINNAVRASTSGGNIDAVILGGDLNLVGSRRPLEILASADHPAGFPLDPVYALQLDGRTAATWRHDGPFGPGRLDWILYSASALTPLRAFVYESVDLSADALSRLGLEAEDSNVTSDHLPVVADLGWKR